MNISFFKIDGLPIYERLTDIKINDIITLCVNNKPIFCKIISESISCINVIELEPLITDKNILFIEKTNFINPTTKNNLSKQEKYIKLQI